MDLKTFQAPSMSEALAEVKSSMGPGAVILHTRTFSRSRWLGLRRQEVVEITAGRGNGPERTARREAPPRPGPTRLTPARLAPPRQDRDPSNIVVPDNRQFLQSPVVQGAAMIGLTQELSTVKSMVKDLLLQARRQNMPQVAPELLEFYSRLVGNQVSEDLASELVQNLGRQIRPEHLHQSDFVRDKLLDQIEKLLPSAGPIVRGKAPGPHIVALIGPTGVGKTTTLAKLAANLKLQENRRVGLITLDTYRIAAIEQLRKYAELIGSPLSVVGTTEDMTDAISTMRQCDFVLIDTAGRSPRDTLKLNELRCFLAAANPHEVHLVLSTTASQSCVELAIERFSAVRADKIILTKLDEAAHLGSVLNVVRNLNKSLSYITTGQDVPKDIEVGRGRRLAQMILGPDSRDTQTQGGNPCQ